MSAGLNSRLSNAVFNYAQNLTGQGYGSSAVMDKAQQYADRLLDYRGNLIARTETIRSSFLGQQSLWNAAVGEGYIDPATTVKVWSATAQTRTCEQCLARDGEETTVDGTFSDGSSGPPAHPDCRCSAILRSSSIQPPRAGAAERLGRSTASQLTVMANSLGDL
jgi:hypothetical protein